MIYKNNNYKNGIMYQDKEGYQHEVQSSNEMTFKEFAQSEWIVFYEEGTLYVKEKNEGGDYEIIEIEIE